MAGAFDETQVVPFDDKEDHKDISPSDQSTNRQNGRRASVSLNVFGRKVSISGPSLESFFTAKGNTAVQFQFASAIEERWQVWADRLRIRASSIRVNATLANLPEDVTSFYDELEMKSGVHLDVATRKLYYEEFLRKSSGFDKLRLSEVAVLIHSRFNLEISPIELQRLVREKIEQSPEVDTDSKDAGDDDLLVHFEIFAQTMCDIIRMESSKPEEDQSAAASLRKLFPLDPESRGKQLWDVTCLLLLLYCSFSVPFSIAFIPLNESGGLTSMDIGDLVIDSLFMIDIGLTFVTSYENQGCVVADFDEIAKNYLQTWFWPDLAGSFPFDIVVAAALQPGSSNDLSAMKGIRMLKLIRALRFVSKLNKLKQKENVEYMGSFISLVSSVFLLIFTAHVLGCFFTMFIFSEPDNNWLLHYNADLVNADIGVRYVTALYWAIISITTMGYGDVLPVTTNERIFTIFVALIGAVVFSTCMGTVASLMTQIAGVDDRFQSRMRSVAEYLQFREIPIGLRRKVKNYYVHCWRRTAVPYDEIEILKELSTPLKSQVLASIGSKIIYDLPIFHGFDHECVGFILSLIKRSQFGEGDTIYNRGELASDMYFLVSGTVKVQWNGPAAAETKSGECNDAVHQDAIHGGKNYKVVRRGDTFGELALFPDILGKFRPETAEAQSWVVAYTLSYDDFMVIRASFQDVAVKLRELCTLKAIECRAIDPSLLAEARVDTGPRQRKIQMCIEELKSDILRHREVTLLLPSAGSCVRQIFTVLRPAASWNGVGQCTFSEAGLQSLSCILSDKGELLYIEHSVEGISHDRPKSIGFLIPGRSTFRVLHKSDIVEYGSSWNKRKLFGCSFVVFAAPDAGGENAESASGPKAALLSDASAAGGEGTTVVLFTWSHKDFAHLRKDLCGWLESSVELDDPVDDSRAHPGSPTTACNNTSGQSALHGSQYFEESEAPAQQAAAGESERSLRQRLAETELQLAEANRELDRFKSVLMAALFPSKTQDACEAPAATALRKNAIGEDSTGHAGTDPANRQATATQPASAATAAAAAPAARTAAEGQPSSKASGVPSLAHKPAAGTREGSLDGRLDLDVEDLDTGAVLPNQADGGATDHSQADTVTAAGSSSPPRRTLAPPPNTVLLR